MKNELIVKLKKYLEFQGKKAIDLETKAVAIATKNADLDLNELHKKYSDFAIFMRDFINDTTKIVWNKGEKTIDELDLDTNIYERINRMQKHCNDALQTLEILPFTSIDKMTIAGAKCSTKNLIEQLELYAFYLAGSLENAIEDPKFNTKEVKIALNISMQFMDSYLKSFEKSLILINHSVSDVKNYDKYKELNSIKKSLINIKRVFSKILWKICNKEKFENKTWQKIKPVGKILDNVYALNGESKNNNSKEM